MAKAAVVGAAAAVAAVAVSEAVLRLFMGQAFDREEPRVMKAAEKYMIGAPENDPRIDEIAAAAKRLRETAMERVEITAPDGLRLVGHWRPCPEPKRAIVAMHGWRGAWYKDFAGIADFWYDNGCSVLFAEQRAQGESEGDTMGFGVLERFDCLAWMQWVNERCGTELPLYPAGISMGATTVLMTANLDLPDNVMGIMADCGFTSPEAIWRQVTEQTFRLPYDLWKQRINRICAEKLHCAPGEVSTLDAMRETKVPVLLVHGEADPFVPASMSVENYEACTSPKKRLLLVPGAKHGWSYLIEPERYRAEVLAFWRDCEEGMA